LRGTRSVIAGSAVTSLLPGVDAFEPGDLDFFTKFGLGHTVVFFLERNRYVVTRMSREYQFAAGIGAVWTMTHPDLLEKINVIESLTDNALDPVPLFHLTCVIGAWHADGLWHAYWELTTNGRALTTPTMITSPTDLPSHVRIWSILRKYSRRGF
ncbi:hypothetical protein C8R43DRAFT_835383, partial [Mycena crocata]